MDKATSLLLEHVGVSGAHMDFINQMIVPLDELEHLKVWEIDNGLKEVTLAAYSPKDQKEVIDYLTAKLGKEPNFRDLGVRPNVVMNLTYMLSESDGDWDSVRLRIYGSESAFLENLHEQN